MYAKFDKNATRLSKSISINSNKISRFRKGRWKQVVSRYRVSSRNVRGSVLVLSYISQIVPRWRKWFDNELTAVPCPDGSAAVDLGWKRRGAKLEHKIRSEGFPVMRGWRKIVRLNYVAEKARKRARDVVLPAKSGLGRRKSAQGRSFHVLRHAHKSSA